MRFRTLLSVFCLVLVQPTLKSAELPDRVAAVVLDRQEPARLDQVHLTGWLGQRITGNAVNRLAKLDPERLLEGYRHRPGRQDWDGEHVGKWLHAATLAWVNTGDAELRTKLDTIVAELARCQLEDGYLGTYTPDKRWTSWDVWAHKYNLIGLLTYVRHTGNQAPLETCRRMADLLCSTFGDGPGQRDIIPAGEHVGLAPTSVLEPMVQLYRLTGEPRYLEFCRYLVRAWEQPNGPKLISTLLNEKRVDRVGNGKAYEMLSCLNGLAELYRITSDPRHLQVCLNAWADIEQNRLYLTGAASYRELFRGDHDLPNTNNVGETCVTVTWLQLNAQLLRLTGEARFADELERVVLNQLLGAQSPDCTAWGYYVQLQGRKPYSTSLTGHCCLSSGPRGVALIPTFALGTDKDGIVVNLYDAGTAQLKLADGTAVGVALDTRYPLDGLISITVQPAATRSFAVRLRIPLWAAGTTLHVNGEESPLAENREGYAFLRRTWSPGDKITLRLSLAPRVMRGGHSNQGKVAFTSGPLVLAADDALLPPEVRNLAAVSIPTADLKATHIVMEPAPGHLRTWPGAQAFYVDALVRETSGAALATVTRRIGLRPFADAGGSGSRYKVWLPLGPVADPNVLLEGVGILAAGQTADDPRLINDGDTNTLAVISTKDPDSGVGFGVQLARPAVIRRVTFVHGMSWGEGGWFDRSAAVPVVQVRREADAPWSTVGEFTDYPPTTATDGARIVQEQVNGLDATDAEVGQLNRKLTFTVRLDIPESVVAVRVVGRPSRGRSVDTYALKCAELQAFAE